jgi:hypothetical protein
MSLGRFDAGAAREGDTQWVTKAATTAVFSVLRGALIALSGVAIGQRVLFRADLPGIAHAPALTSVEFAALRARTDLFEAVAATVRRAT